MAMLPGDYKRRVNSTQRNSSVTSGFANVPVHVPAGATNFEVCQASSVVVNLSINATSAGTNLYFKDSAGTVQEIMSGATTARDYKLHFYCPWPLYISSDVDCTVTVSAPAKGNTTD